MDLDTLITTHAQLQANKMQELAQLNGGGPGKQQMQQVQQPKSNSDELLPLFKEENENLKRKILDLTTMYKQEQQKVHNLQSGAVSTKLKEAEKQIRGLEELIREKDSEIQNLQQISGEYAEMKGKQLLQVIKATTKHPSSADSSNTLQANPQMEEIQNLKQALSEKTNKILKLNEELELAQAAISAMEESNKLKHSQMMSDTQLNTNVEGDNLSQSENNLRAYSVNNDYVLADESLDELSILKQRCSDFDQIKNELLDQIETLKVKARNLLIKKDVQIMKIKIVLTKLESQLRLGTGAMSQEEIFRAAQLKEEDILRLQELEKDLEKEDLINEWDDNQSMSSGFQSQPVIGVSSTQSIVQSALLQRLDAQTSRGRASLIQNGAVATNESAEKNLEYIKNVFVKYLEYLAQNNLKQIQPMESILFTMLNVSREETQRLQLLRSQNTFWKKVLPFQNTIQPLVKNKFNADELKKKLFGGVKNFMGGQLNTSTFNIGELANNSNTQVNLTTYSGGGGGFQSNRPSFIQGAVGAVGEINSQRTSQTGQFNTLASSDLNSVDLRRALGGNTSPRSLEEVKVNKLH